jgi:magnesium transporter
MITGPESALSGPVRVAEGSSQPGSSGTTCKVFRQGEQPQSHADVSEISEILREPGTLVWFDVVNPTHKDLAVLQEEFDLHPLAVEDAVMAHERPKIESYDHYWFLILQATTLENEHIVFHEMAIFAGKKFLVTVRHDPPFAIEEVEKRWNAQPDRLGHGGGFLLYTILDTVVDGYLPVADSFQEKADLLEEPMFQHQATANLLPEIFQMKKQAQQFRRAVVPVRDILNPIIRGDLHLFPEEEVVYYRDVYDHAVRVIDELDSLRDLMGSLLEIHLSVISNRQNEVAKQLTVIATIFLPLSFLASFFGQNFSFLVGHITGAASFAVFGVGVEVLTVALTVAYFKYKNWF